MEVKKPTAIDETFDDVFLRDCFTPRGLLTVWTLVEGLHYDDGGYD